MHLTGTLARAGLISFQLDEFAYIPIWVDEGHITVKCKERASSNKDERDVKIVNLEGPEETRSYYLLSGPRVTWFDFPPGMPQAERDSLSRAGQYNHAVNFIDSIIRVKPHSGITPLYLFSYASILGPEKTSEFYYRLPAGTRESDNGMDVLRYLSRAQLMNTRDTIDDFEMPAQDGSTFRLSEVTAQYILLDFWASWCGTCRAAHSELVKIYNEFGGKDFMIVSISLDENKGDWLEAIKKDGLNWTNVSDLRGWKNALALKYELFAIPHTILIDKNRKIIGVELPAGRLRKVLNTRLKSGK